MKIEVGKQIHGYIFGRIYDFAEQIRGCNIVIAGFELASSMYLKENLAFIDKMLEDMINNVIKKCVKMNIAHYFK